MEIDINHLYAVLRNWIRKGEAFPQSYKQLSSDYEARTGVWLEPHGSWDKPLGDLNKSLAEIGAPPLSALVIVQSENEPGRGFWGSAANVPQRPKSAEERLSVWNECIKRIAAYEKWPDSLLP